MALHVVVKLQLDHKLANTKAHVAGNPATRPQTCKYKSARRGQLKSASRGRFCRRLQRKSQKAHVVRGVRKRKTNARERNCASEKIPDTTHFHPPWGRESRKFLSTIESSLYVISVRNVLLDHLPSSCVSKEGDLSGSRTTAPPRHSDWKVTRTRPRNGREGGAAVRAGDQAHLVIWAGVLVDRGVPAMSLKPRDEDPMRTG